MSISAEEFRAAVAAAATNTATAQATIAEQGARIERVLNAVAGQAVAIVVDRTCSGVRNQDPRLLRFLLPPLIRHYPASLHRAYVGPVNYVFYGIWAVATLILPRRVAGRFMLLRGSDWKAQLRRELGPEVSARLPDNLREGDG